jgi:hypothetical protein
MSHNVEGIMDEHSSLNPISKLQKKINYFTILNEKLNEYMKLVEIYDGLKVFKHVEDERTCNNLSFMKNKLWNQLTIHLNLFISIFPMRIKWRTLLPIVLWF